MENSKNYSNSDSESNYNNNLPNNNIPDNNIIIKNKKGCPTKYREEYNQQVYKLCLLGATDKEIADFFDVDERTINNWKTDYPDFFQSIRDGKIGADMNSAQSLYKKANGYEIEEEEAKVVSLGKDCGSKIEIVKVKKYYPPDTAALNIWLKNRRGKIKDVDDSGQETGGHKWADKQEIDHTTNGKPITISVINYSDSKTNADTNTV